MKDDEFLEFINSEEWKEYKLEMDKKKNYSKNGANVLHFQYLGSLFEESDFIEYRKRLNKVGFDLSRFDKSGVFYASIENFDLVTYIAISQPFINELLKGIYTNATWDVIKQIVFSIWQKTKNKTYNKVTKDHFECKEITFGLKVQLDNNTKFNISLKGDLEESVILNSLDTVLDFLREQKLNKEYKIADYIYFDSCSEKWVKIDVDQAIREMIQKEK